MANATDGERFEAEPGDRSDREQGNIVEASPHPPLMEVQT